MPFSRGPSEPRIKPSSPALQADSLPSDHEGSPPVGSEVVHFLMSVGLSAPLVFASVGFLSALNLYFCDYFLKLSVSI